MVQTAKRKQVCHPLGDFVSDVLPQAVDEYAFESWLFCSMFYGGLNFCDLLLELDECLLPYFNKHLRQ